MLKLAKSWPVITDACDPLEDAEDRNGKKGKLELLEKNPCSFAKTKKNRIKSGFFYNS